MRVGHLSALGQEQPHDAFVGEPPVATDLAAFFHTGGTTGTPKLAAHTHANEVSDAWMIAVTSLLHDDAVVFAALPLFHVNALLVTVLAPLFRGLHVIWAGPEGYRDQALHSNFWKLIERFRIPDETYKYVFSIVSAAVIGENPRAFGFTFDNPLAGALAQYESSR